MAGTTARGHYSTVSIYEYRDERRHIITGKRIRFRFEQAYSTTADRRDGPHISLDLLYDIDSLQPSLAQPEREPKSGPGHASASLVRRAVGGDLTPETIVGSTGPFGTIGMLPRPGLIRRRDICGMHAYDVTTTGTLELGAQSKAVTAPDWPSQSSLVLAVPDPNGKFSAVIGCSTMNIVRGYPMCRSLSRYRGWPLEIVFSGGDLCRHDRVLAGARTLFDRFYLDQTERSPGQIEHRWSPAARPAQASAS